MKSAYELAMERMGGSEKKPLTDEQKVRIAEVDAKFKAKIAERKIFLEKGIQDALANGKADEADQLRSQLAQESAKLEVKSEEEKDKIRSSWFFQSPSSGMCKEGFFLRLPANFAILLAGHVA